SLVPADTWSGEIGVRACIPQLAMLMVIGLAPGAFVWGQNRLEAASAQEPPAAERPPPNNAPAPPAGLPNRSPGSTVEASQLDTFLLRDRKGNLVPVLGLPFEEFEQLLRTKKGLASPPAPGYVLEKLSLVGAVDQRIADLQVTATI